MLIADQNVSNFLNYCTQFNSNNKTAALRVEQVDDKKIRKKAPRKQKKMRFHQTKLFCDFATYQSLLWIFFSKFFCSFKKKKKTFLRGDHSWVMPVYPLIGLPISVNYAKIIICMHIWYISYLIVKKLRLFFKRNVIKNL